MSTCGNCKAKLGCSCKKRTASDGKSCCANCLSRYEKIIKNNSNKTSPGVILSAKAE